jgi:hypothetical protein
MYSDAKFIEAGLTISPNSLAKSITVGYAYSNLSTPQTQSENCAFDKGIVYTLKVGIDFDTKYSVTGNLYQGDVVVCTVSMTPAPFTPSAFFSQPFTFILSQSASGATLKRSLRAATQESMSIKVQQIGVECKTGNCGSGSAPSSTAQKALFSGDGANIALIAGVVAAIMGLIVIVIVVGIIVAAVIVQRRRRRQVSIYEATVDSMKYDEVEEEEPEQNPSLTLYDAFAQSQNQNLE